MVHRIRLFAGYHGNEIGRYQTLGSREALGDYGNRVNPAFWRLDERALPLHECRARGHVDCEAPVGPVKNAAGSTVYLYRLPGDNPPAWVAAAYVKAGRRGHAGTILDPRFDPLRVAVLDSTSSVAAPALKALPEPLAITTKVTRYEAGHIALELSAPAPAGSAIVVSENYFPGLDGSCRRPRGGAGHPDRLHLPRPAASGRCDAGSAWTSTIRRTARGKTVTLVALLLALLALGAGLLLDRRRVA